MEKKTYTLIDLCNIRSALQNEIIRKEAGEEKNKENIIKSYTETLRKTDSNIKTM